MTRRRLESRTRTSPKWLPQRPHPPTRADDLWHHPIAPRHPPAAPSPETSRAHVIPGPAAGPSGPHQPPETGPFLKPAPIYLTIATSHPDHGRPERSPGLWRAIGVEPVLRYPENAQRAAIQLWHLLTSRGSGQKESTASPKASTVLSGGERSHAVDRSYTPCPAVSPDDNVTLSYLEVLRSEPACPLPLAVFGEV